MTLDTDKLKAGFYAKGRDGNFYKVDLPVDFPATKYINVLTGEAHYPNNYSRVKSLSMEEMAVWLASIGPIPEVMLKFWREWLKEEIADV